MEELKTGYGIIGYTGLNKNGGGDTPTPGTLGPETVGSDEIINGSVQLEDLNQEVKDKLVDHVTEEELDTFNV